MYFAYMGVPHPCLVPSEAEEGAGCPVKDSCESSVDAKYRIQFSVRAAGALNLRAVAPAPEVLKSVQQAPDPVIPAPGCSLF